MIINQKNKTILIIAVFFALATISGGLYWWRFKVKQRILADKQQQEMVAKEVSVGYAIISRAVSAKDPAICAELKDQPVMDSCYASVSQLLSDKTICIKIVELAARVRCIDFLTFRDKLKSLTKADCDSFNSNEIKTTCYNQLFSSYDKLTQCDEFLESQKSQCVDMVNSRLAIANRDDDCEAVVNESMKSSCKIAVSNTPKDSDKDGLSDTLEISYGTDSFKADTDGDGLKDGEEITGYQTDPKNADTDKDGHGDGEEVKGGFNPLGPGKTEKK
ncbi:hypothetical protein HGA64_00520 [Candidatus Falkowbacteria bacterium]|nr:hypothetical protein [Candidatus Falkowbacteria bacterium]